MRKYLEVLGALSMSLASLLGIVEASHAQGNPVTAIDILLEPDATMVQHAHADNARLLRAYPKGFALDATHHSTMIIRPPQHGHRRRAIIQTGQGFEPPITARCAPRRSWEDAHSPLAPSNRREPRDRSQRTSLGGLQTPARRPTSPFVNGPASETLV